MAGSVQTAAAAGFLAAHAEQVADRDDQVGAVERVEMELVHALGLQPAALLGGERGGDQAARVGIVVEPVEMRRHPGRDRGAAGRAELLNLGEIGDRQDARHDRHRDPGRRGAVAKSQKEIDIEKVLGDRPVGAGIDLALEIVEVVLGAFRLGMGLGIGGDADLEIGDALQPGDQIGGKGIAPRLRRIGRCPPAGGSPRSATMWRMPACQ